MTTVNKKIDDVADKAKKTTTDVAEKINEGIDQGEDNLHHIFDTAKETCADFENNLTTYVKDHPLKAVGIALFAGFMLSRFL